MARVHVKIYFQFSRNVCKLMLVFRPFLYLRDSKIYEYHHIITLKLRNDKMTTCSIVIKI